MRKPSNVNEAALLLVAAVVAACKGRPDTRPRDAAPPRPLDASAPTDASTIGSRVCPVWSRAAPAGSGWLFVQVESTDGPVLTSARNKIDVYVRQASDTSLGDRAEADDPCTVGTFSNAWPKVAILAAAVGFSTQERQFSPTTCTDQTPCTIALAPRLPADYYYISGAGSASTPSDFRVLTAHEVPVEKRSQFAAAMADDALGRAKALKRPLSVELDKTSNVTKIPARDLAIHYAETKLNRHCDLSCLQDASLDADMKAYLKHLNPGHSPFELRTPLDHWDR